MEQKIRHRRIFAALCALFLLLSGCGDDSAVSPSAPSAHTAETVQGTKVPHNDASPVQHRQTCADILVPQVPGTTVYEGETVCLDASCTDRGYIALKYTGENKKIKMQLTMPDSTVYTYSLKPGDFEIFPLSGENGTYNVAVYENAYDNMYAMVFSQELEVTISDPFSPYLYPNQYVWYTQDTQTFQKSAELSDISADDMDFVRNVYKFMIENVDYDHELAENVPVGYLPEVDRTLATKKGICFDYAALMAAMLRMQGIPTRLVIGYSGEQYHAWIDVYLDEEGWIDNIIYFDGKSWSLVDPTLGANSSSSKVKKYLGDGTHYLEKYHY